MPRSFAFVLCCLVAGCAGQTAADSAQVRAAFDVYQKCLRNYVGSADTDASLDPEEVGITLAGYCLQEFSAYRNLSGVDESDNERDATRVVIVKRRN